MPNCSSVPWILSDTWMLRPLSPNQVIMFRTPGCPQPLHPPSHSPQPHLSGPLPPDVAPHWLNNLQWHKSAPLVLWHFHMLFPLLGKPFHFPPPPCPLPHRTWQTPLSGLNYSYQGHQWSVLPNPRVSSLCSSCATSWQYLMQTTILTCFKPFSFFWLSEYLFSFFYIVGHPFLMSWFVCLFFHVFLQQIFTKSLLLAEVLG